MCTVNVPKVEHVPKGERYFSLIVIRIDVKQSMIDQIVNSKSFDFRCILISFLVFSKSLPPLLYFYARKWSLKNHKFNSHIKIVDFCASAIKFEDSYEEKRNETIESVRL